MSPITQAELRRHLQYDETTGAFTRIKWKGRPAGATVKGYYRIGINRARYYAHRLAWFYVYNEWPNGDIDHRDGNKKNNRISNLRIASRAQNLANSFRSNPSGYKGITPYRDNPGKWCAQIRVNSRTLHLGCFDTRENAHAAYRAAAEKYYGEFARTTEPLSEQEDDQ